MSVTPKFPQDWPGHLNGDSDVSPVRSILPAGEHLLNFSDMPAATFEQFCWWLIQKNHDLVGCKRLGGSGQEQGGIDIFAFLKEQRDYLIVFECKCWKKYRASEMKEAVDNFLAGPWKTWCKKFVLILAQREVGPSLAHRWVEDEKRLRNAGVDAELWTGHTLTVKTQLWPDVVSKFFPNANLHSFANEWMEKVAFYEHLNKAAFHPQKNISKWAQNIIERSGKGVSDEESSQADGATRTVKHGDGHWNYSGPWFHVSAILPTQALTPASAAINFKTPNLAGATIVVTQGWFLAQMSANPGAPLEHQYRNFIVNHDKPDDGIYHVDLKNCRMALPEQVTAELSSVADKLSEEIKEAIFKLENKWGSKGFPIVDRNTSNIAIASTNKTTWRLIIEFAKEHDFSKGDSAWHMFDAAPNVLKPYTRHTSERFKSGYHGVFILQKIQSNIQMTMTC